MLITVPPTSLAPNSFLSTPALESSHTAKASTLLFTYTKYKVWLKPTSKMSFIYSNHVLKGGLLRITENITPSDVVVVFSVSNAPLGFGIVATSTQDCRMLDPNGIVVLHQADIGDCLRMEDKF